MRFPGRTVSDSTGTDGYTARHSWVIKTSTELASKKLYPASGWDSSSHCILQRPLKDPGSFQVVSNALGAGGCDPGAHLNEPVQGETAAFADTAFLFLFELGLHHVPWWSLHGMFASGPYIACMFACRLQG